MLIPYKDGRALRFWSTAVREPLENNKNFEIESLLQFMNEATIVCSAGSCFAQHIGKNLIKRQFKFLLSKFSEDRLESFGFGNVYTTRQLRQWLEFSMKDLIWSNDTFFHNEEGQFYDYLIPHLSPLNSELALSDRRTKICSEFISYIERADVFIFTCGLTEQWVTQYGEALAMCPGTLFGEFDPTKFRMQNLSFEEISDDLKAIEYMVSSINPKIKIIFTVSPVPLTATAEKENILVANSFSKTKLRAAVGEHVLKSSISSYFPSFELITFNTLGDWRFEKNLRSVSTQGVDYVMRHGFNEQYASERIEIENSQLLEEAELHCEEQKLETLNMASTLKHQNDPIFLIGDSHMGYLATALKSRGKFICGGQVMNGSGWSDHKFRLDEKKIFIPEESDKSKEIWDKIFDVLEQYKGSAVIYTNIGFQTHRHIPRIINFTGGLQWLTLQDVADYFSNHQTGVLEVLARLSEYGRITFVEDPNCWSVSKSANSEAEELLVDLMKINFPVYVQYIKNVSDLLNCEYLSAFNAILQNTHYETGNGLKAVGNDGVHGSEIYYKKLAENFIV